MHIAFYAEQLYYLPQFSPVMHALQARGHRVTLVLRLEPALREITLQLPSPEAGGPEVLRVGKAAEAYEALRRLAPQWVVFGSFIDPAETLPAGTRTALVYHGIGVKSVLFDPRLNRFDLRCVESQRVLDESIARDPAARDRLALVGFAKLDPLLGPQAAVRRPDAERPVLLYAPTFYPSSLELMPRRLREVAPRAQWLVKPHFFTWTVKDYAGQRKRLAAWAEEPGVQVLGPEHYDLVPLMAQADVLISDASSALFEFAALGRPVVWCRFLKLRWSYRGLFKWRLGQRMDPNAQRYETVAHCVDQARELPALLERLRSGADVETPEQRAARDALIEHLIGPRDGRASERIADELERRSA